MKYRLILLLASLLTLSSCSKDDNDSNLKDLIVGTWYYDTKALRQTYYYLVFNENGTGIEGNYYVPDPQDESRNWKMSFRYAIIDGKIGRCYDETHTHPIKPGESCPPDKVVFDPLHVDKNTLRIDAWSSGNRTYTRYTK